MGFLSVRDYCSSRRTAVPHFLKARPHSSRRDFSVSLTSHLSRLLNPTRGVFHRYKNRNVGVSSQWGSINHGRENHKELQANLSQQHLPAVGPLGRWGQGSACPIAQRTDLHGICVPWGTLLTCRLPFNKWTFYFRIFLDLQTGCKDTTRVPKFSFI